jgi:hypothetical protein
MQLRNRTYESSPAAAAASTNTTKSKKQKNAVEKAKDIVRAQVSKRAQEKASYYQKKALEKNKSDNGDDYKTTQERRDFNQKMVTFINCVNMLQSTIIQIDRHLV